MKKYEIDGVEIYTHHKKPSFFHRHEETIGLIFILTATILVWIGTYYTYELYRLTK